MVTKELIKYIQNMTPYSQMGNKTTSALLIPFLTVNENDSVILLLGFTKAVQRFNTVLISKKKKK